MAGRRPGCPCFYKVSVEHYRKVDAAPRNGAPLASASLSTSARSSCSCGCAITDRAATTYLAGPKISSWYHVHQVCRQYRAPGSCYSRGSCTTHEASTGSTSNWFQKQTGIHQNAASWRATIPDLKYFPCLLIQPTLVLVIYER
jgi:hypothetical protein